MLSDTVHVVVPVPVKELLAQERALIDGEIVDAAPLRLIVADFETEPFDAVNFTVCEAVTADTVALKVPLEAPEATVIEGGTAIAVLLLASETANPELGAGALNVTVQASVPAPIMELLPQLKPDSEAVCAFAPLP